MTQLSKNDDSSLCYGLIIKLQKLKIDKLTILVIFRAISIITVRQMYLEMLSPIYSINGDHRRPKGASGGSAAQRKQAKRTCYGIKLQNWQILRFSNGIDNKVNRRI